MDQVLRIVAEASPIMGWTCSCQKIHCGENGTTVAQNGGGLFNCTRGRFVFHCDSQQFLNVRQPSLHKLAFPIKGISKDRRVPFNFVASAVFSRRKSFRNPLPPPSSASSSLGSRKFDQHMWLTLHTISSSPTILRFLLWLSRETSLSAQYSYECTKNAIKGCWKFHEGVNSTKRLGRLF